jgi:antitoxin ParD1/3/4
VKSVLANFANRVILPANRKGFRRMPTRNVSLTKEQDAFVEKMVESGEYQNASEAIRDALRTLQRRRKEDALKLKALRAAIKAGVDELERGEYTEFDDAGLKAYLSQLAISSGKAKS